MTKFEFLSVLRKGLVGLPQNEIEERLLFYSEMIDDRIEEGLTEEEAVLTVGKIDEVIATVMSDSTIVIEKVSTKRKHNVWGIVLIALGTPIWFPILIALFAVFFSLFVSVWSVIVSLWAVFGSVIASALCGITVGAFFATCVNTLTGVAMIGVGIALLGISIFTYYLCKEATKGTVWLMKKTIVLIKNCFSKKEAA